MAVDRPGAQGGAGLADDRFLHAALQDERPVRRPTGHHPDNFGRIPHKIIATIAV
jgi:hypothetical protein